MKLKLLRQFLIILLLSFVGEGLHALLPLPVPASVWGLVLMLLCLCTGIIRLEQVERAADFLILIMPVMFVPAAVGLTESCEQLRPVLVPMVVIMVLTTVLVMVVTGHVSQFIIKRREKRGGVSGKFPVFRGGGQPDRI